MDQVLIIGGGLTGLALAYLLEEQGVAYKVLEARDRWGGRILTDTTAVPPIEMGATWHWSYHEHVQAWLSKLDLARFPQFQQGLARYDQGPRQPSVPFQIPPQEPSFRIAGGTQQLIEVLVQALPNHKLHLRTPIRTLRFEGGAWTAISEDGEEGKAVRIVSTLPPGLFASQIAVSPGLPKALTEVMEHTQTWMGDAIKYAVRYAHPFWRDQGWAGAGFSQSGPATEVHDHTDIEEKGAALKGFLHPEVRALPTGRWEAALLQQLERMYGPKAREHVGVAFLDWQKEAYTHSPQPNVMPHANQGHAVYQQPYAQDTLWIAGAETSPHYGGYLEGALYSAEAVCRQLMATINAETV